jgi:DNA invertase Pin-like site-specific DNA recombinase
MAAQQATAAAAYVRVATGSARAREGSIRIQRQAIARYATLRSLGIARWFSDHDCIADIEHRQGLHDAMKFIAGGHAKILIVADLARITRSHGDFVKFIERFRFLDGDLTLSSVRDKLDTRTQEGRAMLGMLHTLAGLDGADLREPWRT